jgi:hypothetical protein
MLIHLQLGSSSTNQVVVFSTVEQALWGAPSALGNLALTQDEDRRFVMNSNTPKPFHFGEMQSLYVFPVSSASLHAY